jgi:predicted metalloendopeptidase
MPNTVGRLWVDHHCDPALKRDVSNLVETIRSAAIAALKKTSWMELKTRDMAVRKLRKMRVDICWPEPDEWNVTEVSCTFSRTNLINNMLSLGKLVADNNQKILMSGDCRHPHGKGWDKPVFDVNAYYFPDENRFILPAAILRPPFYDTKKSVIWNYGAIGATIGHEFCHAFDSDGRMYDENGDKRNWWTDGDSKEYDKKARRVVKLYDSTLYRGLKVNGELTLIENIADIGGLEFALAGARYAMGRALTKAELREFFTSFATSWRSKDRLKRAAQLLVTDMHSPPELRVNLVTQQMDEWYEAFDVDPTCNSWIAPEDRIHFFV